MYDYKDNEQIHFQTDTNIRIYTHFFSIYGLPRFQLLEVKYM